jgi:hypothetical protein
MARPVTLGWGHVRVTGRAVFDSEDAPLTAEVHDTEPSIEPEAESVGDFDLRVLSGFLVMEESGGTEGRTELPVPVGVQTPRPGRYLLQLWPASARAPVSRLRSSLRGS